MTKSVRIGVTSVRFRVRIRVRGFSGAPGSQVPMGPPLVLGPAQDPRA